MPDIVLTTLNARYAHASFGLRYLMANLGELGPRTSLLEFDINQRPTDVLEVILRHGPKIVGLGVYIWNVEQATRLVADFKRVAPEVIVVLGGPEVSYETDQQEIVRLADHTITGEADVTFAAVCRRLLAGERVEKVAVSPLPTFDELRLPYYLYNEQDLAHRVVYVEASRGCPFSCEFCLSSLDVPVRLVALEPFLAAMDDLLRRGCRAFKFVDRTFNLNLKTSAAILEFFLQRYTPGLFLHFEMIPDRLPAGLREIIQRFPPGALQFEVGIQTFNDDVCELISRRQDARKLEENLTFLREHTGVHIHADLIVGLPGEDIESFARGFDRLVALRPQEIQVGMLKRLRGTPIARHDEAWGMVYSPQAPYEVLKTKLIPFAEMQRMRRFARYWDLIANSGNFVDTLPLIWAGGSPFGAFMALSDWLHETAGRTHGIALERLAQMLFGYLTAELGRDASQVGEAMWRDYQRGGRRDCPTFLRPFVAEPQPLHRRERASTMPRQARHAE